MSAKRSLHHNFIDKYGVPGGWEAVRLRDVVQIVGGGTPESSEPAYWDGSIPWLTPTEMASLKGRYATDSEHRISEQGLNCSNCRLLPPGSIVITTRGTIGNVAIAGIPLTCNQSCEALLPRDVVDAEYLYYLLTYLRPLVERFGAGTTFPSVTRRDIRDIRFAMPKPDSGEQRLIADILVATDEIITAAEEKLTATQRLKAALMQQLFTRGIPGRHTNFIKVRVFRHEFLVPETWNVATLRNSINAVEYGTNEPSNDEKHGLPVVAIPQVIDTRFRLGECSYSEVSEKEASSLRLSPDDVLLIRTNGNSDYIGKSTVIGDEAVNQHIIFASYLIRIKTNKEFLSGKYLNYFLASTLGRRQCLAMANTSAGNHNLGSRAIKHFCFPRPSLTEQTDIVDLLDSAEDAIEAAYREVNELGRLKRSLLQNLLTGRVRVRS